MSDKNNTCCGYPVHEAAACLPLLPAHELDELADSIKRNGLRDSVVLLDGAVLDGRNRLMACKKAGVSPHFELFNGESPAEFVIDKNAKRRNLTASQKAVFAAAILPILEREAEARKKSGINQHSSHGAKLPEASNGRARDKAAAALKVSPRYVADAKRIKAKSPETFEKIANGEKTISEAKRELWELNKIPAIKEHDPDDKDSDTLFHLKRYWRRASKKDRKAFQRWVKTQTK